MSITTDRTVEDLEFGKLKKILSTFAVSSLGEEAIDRLSPTADEEKIERLLEEVREFTRILKGTDPLILGELTPLTPYLDVAHEHPPLSPEQFLEINNTLENGLEAKKHINGLSADFPRLSHLADKIGSFFDLRKQIKSTIDRRGKIREDASRDLLQLIDRKRSTEEQVKDRLNDFLSSHSSQIQDNVVARRSNRLVVPLKSSSRNQVNCVVHESSNSGRTVFAEPSSTVELNNKIRDLSSEIREEKQRILKDITETFSARESKLRRTQEALRRLDCTYARARFSLEYSCSIPKIVKGTKINLIDARHPLLDQEEVVPVSLGFGDDSLGGVITGPNTGGKTVTLKTVGLFALMVQSGIPIPASVDSQLPIFEGIYSDIGDEQSIEQSLSTFSSHMSNIVDILGHIDEDSLVLWDELGAGTDPREGAALGLGLTEHLLEVGAKFVVTTHFTALKNFGFNHPDIVTFSVDFDPEELKPTYHVLEGVPGQSNAFIIASRLGLPDEIISNARDFLQEGQVQAEDIIEQLAGEKRKAKKKREKMEKKLSDAQRMKNEYERNLSQLEENKQQALSEEIRDVEKFLHQAKKELESVIADKKDRKLEDLREGRDRIDKLEQELESKKNALEQENEGTSLNLDQLEEDQKVWVCSAGNHGYLQRIKDEGRIEVEVQGMTLETALNDLQPPRDQSQQAEQSGTYDYDSTVGEADLELNVRGQTVVEALREVDQYYDRIVRSNMDEGRILHGKGSGKLRREIRKHLRELPDVDRYYSPPPSQGGTGVTIFELRSVQ